MLKELTTINGNTFIKEIVSKEEVSVLEVGYIITPTGEFIKIVGDHNIELSDYINTYLENKTMQYYDIFEAIKILTSLNHIVYGGIRKEDIKSIKHGTNISSLCTIYLPDDDLTDQQKQSLRTLLDTNYSIINPYQKKVDLNVFKLSSPIPLFDEEINKLLKISISKKE